jgi:hypothetical protein
MKIEVSDQDNKELVGISINGKLYRATGLMVWIEVV